jgi:hypothetical protein
MKLIDHHRIAKLITEDPDVESEYAGLEDNDEFESDLESFEIQHLRTLIPNTPLLFIHDSEMGDRIYLGDLKSLRHLHAATGEIGDLSNVGDFPAYDTDRYQEDPLEPFWAESSIINVQMEKREI